MRDSDVQRMIESIQNALAGEKVVCDDDHEYSIGTKEAYEEFVRRRNFEKSNFEIPVSRSTSEKPTGKNFQINDGSSKTL